MFPPDMASIRTNVVYFSRAHRMGLSVVLIAATIGCGALWRYRQTGQQVPAPELHAQPTIIAEAPHLLLSPEVSAQKSKPFRYSEPRTIWQDRYGGAAWVANSDGGPIQGLPGNDGRPALEPGAMLPKATIEPIPPWTLGDPARQLIPNYVAGMATTMLVAPPSEP